MRAAPVRGLGGGRARVAVPQEGPEGELPHRVLVLGGQPTLREPQVAGGAQFVVEQRQVAGEPGQRGEQRGQVGVGEGAAQGRFVGGEEAGGPGVRHGVPGVVVDGWGCRRAQTPGRACSARLMSSAASSKTSRTPGSQKKPWIAPA
ncbi:hypothetical protein GCM10025734_74400 [Kitasatospora paranensis]